MERPRVLVTSIPVWNNESGSDTFANLLSGYDSDKVANIFFKSGIPSSSACSKYFFISENAVIKSIFSRKGSTGRVVESDTSKDILSECVVEKKRYSFFSKHRLWVFLLGRELLWKLGKWKSKEVDNFIESFNPEVVFYPIEGYLYFNRFTEYLLNKSKAVSVGIIWDDNFTYKVHPKNIGFRIHRFFLRKQVKRISEKSDKIFVINKKMQKELKEEFGFDSEILTKGANVSHSDTSNVNSGDEITITYTGKLNLGRLDSVAMLANVLESANKNSSHKYRLDVYSGTFLSEKEKKSLNKNGTHFMGSVSQSEVSKIQSRADMLLVAEAIKGKNKYDARLSFSTKIVDYLAAGKCILAIGPYDIAPIEYLKDEDAAIVASSNESLSKLFMEGRITQRLIEEYGRKAYNIALKNHNIVDIQARLYSSFECVKRDQSIE